MATRLVLFDDAVAQAWWPFTLTRPAAELRFGVYTLRERAERATGAPCAGYMAAAHLAAFDEPGCPPVLPREEGPVPGDTIYLSSRAVLEPGFPPIDPIVRTAVLTVGGEPCGWFARAGEPAPDEAFLLDPASSAPADAPRIECPGRLLARVWELVTENADRLARDIRERFPDAPAPTLPEGVRAFGGEPLVLGEGVHVDPAVVFDLRRGPIWVDAGASIAAFTRLAGPAYIGPHTVLLGGEFDTLAAGPHCKLRGEVQHSVILGYSNKAHEGHLGHAYLGAWVNLGAFTTNSDLKNNYGTVALWTPGGEVDTGEIKLGCLIGDHVKTAIGTLINTGTVIGPGANVVGNGLLPKYIPPFQWGTGSDATEYDLEKFLGTAETVMARRGVRLSERQRTLLAAAWRLGRSAS